MTLRWYVAQTSPKLEAFAHSQLINQDFEIFLPLYKKRVFKKSILHSIYPLFSGYLFVRFDKDIDQWRSINGTKGVKKLLGMDSEKPSPINPIFIEEMMQKTDKMGFIDLGEADETICNFRQGDQLKIMGGVFKGHIGTYELNDKKRISILLACIGGKNRVWVDQSNVILATA